MMIFGCKHPGSHPGSESPEPLPAYAELQADGVTSSDIDWYASEFDRIFEQTLGGGRIG